MMIERRQFARFRTRDKAYATLRGDFTKVGKIKDISLNGLSFNYLSEDMQKEEFLYVDIFMVGNDFHLIGVPCRIRYDVKESTFGLDDVSAYRCGMEFGALKKEQQNKLEFFLNNHTTGKAANVRNQLEEALFRRNPESFGSAVEGRTEGRPLRWDDGRRMTEGRGKDRSKKVRRSEG
jgi:PilZ domain